MLLTLWPWFQGIKRVCMVSISISFYMLPSNIKLKCAPHSDGVPHIKMHYHMTLTAVFASDK